MTAEERAALKLNIDEAKFLEAVDREGNHEIGVGSAMTADRRAALQQKTKMFSEEEAEILRTLLNRLQEALSIKKAPAAIRAVQAAYMKAAYDKRDLERSRRRMIEIRGSEAAP